MKGDDIVAWAYYVYIIGVFLSNSTLTVLLCQLDIGCKVLELVTEVH